MCVCVYTHLLPSVDDILCVRQSVDTRSSYNRVVTRGGVGHFHGAELKEGLAQCYSAEQHLPGMTNTQDAAVSGTNGHIFGRTQTIFQMSHK